MKILLNLLKHWKYEAIYKINFSPLFHIEKRSYESAHFQR